jgi:hypothetical protein
MSVTRAVGGCQRMNEGGPTRSGLPFDRTDQRVSGRQREPDDGLADGDKLRSLQAPATRFMHRHLPVQRKQGGEFAFSSPRRSRRLPR